jgi:hypothetical protein
MQKELTFSGMVGPIKKGFEPPPPRKRFEPRMVKSLELGRVVSRWKP